MGITGEQYDNFFRFTSAQIQGLRVKGIEGSWASDQVEGHVHDPIDIDTYVASQLARQDRWTERQIMID